MNSYKQEPVRLSGSVLSTPDRIGLDLKEVEIPPIDPNDSRTMLELIINRAREGQSGHEPSKENEAAPQNPIADEK
jgi:hypothetical protein